MRNFVATLVLLFGLSFFATAVYVSATKPIETIETIAPPLSPEELAVFDDAEREARMAARISRVQAAPLSPKSPPRFGLSSISRLDEAPAYAPAEAAAAAGNNSKAKKPKSETATVTTAVPQTRVAAAPPTSDDQKRPPSTKEVKGPLPTPAAAAATAAVSPKDSEDASNSRLVEDLEADIACRARMRKLGVVNSEKCIDISDVVKDLSVGTYAFNKPLKAYVGDPFHMTLVLKTTPKQEIDSIFAGRLGSVTSKEGKFAQSVGATLRGDDVSVDPAGYQSKTATREEPVEWDWVLKPSAPGEKTIIIEVVANIQAGPDRHQVSIRTFHEAITIEVSYYQRIKLYAVAIGGYILAASAVVTALAGMVGFVPSIRTLVVGIFRRRKEFPRYGR